MELLTSQQMQAIEEAAIASGVVTGLALMERAGAAVAAAAVRLAGRGGAPGRAVVLCGPGGNGGDGYVAARLLAARGWNVEVFGLGDLAKAPPDAAASRRAWEAAGAVRSLADLAQVRRGADVMIDALFGGGLTRALPGAVEAALGAVWPSDSDDAPLWRRALAVDAPSGLCLDTGRTRGFALHADLTVTFHRPKVGHYVGEGPRLCGRLEVADIGLEGFWPGDRSAAFHRRIVLTEAPVRAAEKAGGGHKYDHGHVLVLAGGVGRGGAARLAARGALRVGAGLVTVGAPAAAMEENAARLDAIMLRRVDGPQDLAALLAEGRVNCVVMGPGLGVGPQTLALLDAALAAQEGRLKLVLDADALTSLAQRPDPNPVGYPERIGWRRDYGGRTRRRVVLTPHLGEFRRLFPEYAEGWAPGDRALRYGKVQAVAEVSCESGCTVLLKGPDTVIADCSGHVSVSAAFHDRAAPWLATAGSGDVLAGMIGGLLARGWPPREAAADAAWLHQEAGRALGPGLIAEDIPEALPRIFRRLARGRESDL